MQEERPYKMEYDDEYQALQSVVATSDKPFKAVAKFLFPHLKDESAYARLKACLNPSKDDRLTFAQIIIMCRFCGRFDALHFFADECSHQRPSLKPPENEEAYLMQEFIGAKQDLAKIAARLEAIHAQKVGFGS